MRFGCRENRGMRFFLLLALSIGSSELAFYARAEEIAAQSSGSQKVTMQFQGMEIEEVLKILSEQAGFNLVIGKNVSGRVTLFVKEVDPWEALEVILAANELAYERRGPILTIMTQRDYEILHGQPYQDRRVLKTFAPRYARATSLSQALSQIKSSIGRVIADEATNTLILMDTPDLAEKMLKLSQEMDQPLETRIFSLNYAAIKSLAPLLQEAITKGVGSISADERSNQVAVTDYPEKLDDLSRMIQAFDEQTTEVFIDAKIVQITLSDKFQLGIDWDYFLSKQLKLEGLNALNLTAGGRITWTTLDANKTGETKTVLEALRTFGDTRILSEPTLTVVNNQEAKILVGTKEPYATKSTSQTGTGTAVTAETINFIDVGVKLFVTPTITRDGFILMKIRPEVSSKTGTLTTSEKNEIPIVETTEAETTLLVQDGGTVILGGLIKDEKSIDDQRIPFLGDIPILGVPFRSRKETVKKTETVLFLTSRIVTGRREGVEPASEKSAQEAVASQQMSEQEYQSFLQKRIESIARVQAPLFGMRGKVIVEFTLSREGRLASGQPRIVRSDSQSLEPLARQAVLAASPFPPLPLDLDWTERTFRVAINYD